MPNRREFIKKSLLGTAGLTLGGTLPDTSLASPAAPKIAAQNTPYQSPGIVDNLPVFHEKLAERLTFPLSWHSGNYDDFTEWRAAARTRVIDSLLYSPPPADFDPEVLDEEDRGSYTARKIVLHITADSRVLTYLLRPKGDGPFPAVLLLHDHGGRFDIGKEKMIRPFHAGPETRESAAEWVDANYAGRFLGDELAGKGFVCLAADALNWSDRGGAPHDGQQAIAGNLFHLGSSLAGTIAVEDMRAAEFLSGLPDVDVGSVAVMGFSMGGFRSWQVAALSDHITSAVAVSWMACVKDLMQPGNNLVRGQSAFTTLHPGLHRYLDYPDVAGIACPKPLLMYNGSRDHLFPADSVARAYDNMHRLWESQGVGENLVTRTWDAGHEFTLEMQEEAFRWMSG
jgi:dienelactone hydrolase